MKLVPLLPLLLVAGCTAVGPNYTPPQADLTATFAGGRADSAGDLTGHAWWGQYRDPLLTKFVTDGLAQSLDIALAREQIAQAEAQLRETGVNAALDSTATASQLAEGGSGTTSKWATDTTLDGSVVLDFFGGLRRSREGALASVAGAKANVEVKRLAWLADLVAAYANARYYQQAVALTRASIASRVETVSITRHKFDVGSATQYEVSEAEALLETARADLPQYAALFNSNVLAMADLLNQPAQPILAAMQKGAPQPRLPPAAAVGIPADLIRNRPDIRYEEAQVHSAVAAVGVAEADLYPSITLTGDITTTAGASSWSFGPELSLPVLNHGYLAAVRDAKISAARQAEITWRSTVSGAVKDVQVALSNLRHYTTRAAALQKAAAAYARALELERESYRNGAITLLDLLATDRDSAAAQISAASAQNDAAQEWATLQIAAGAGS